MNINTFNRVAISVACFSIFSATGQNIAMADAFSNEQMCRDSVRQKLQEANFGSDAANKSKPVIIPFTLPRAMDIIKRSNRGELDSSEARIQAVKQELSAKRIKWLVSDSDAVSREAVAQIEPLLKSECQQVE